MQRIPLHLFAIIFVMATGSAFGQEQSLAEQIMDADEAQFAVIFPKLKEQAEKEVRVLVAEIERKLPQDANEDDKEKVAKRQANAAVALLKLNHPEKVWQLLKHSLDPRARSYLIHRMGPFGVDPKVIINRLDDETEVSIRRALILSLGEFDTSALLLEHRTAFLPKLQEIYRTNPDPGLHAASELLLRMWQQNDWLKQVDEEWANDKVQREKWLNGIEKSLAKENRSPQWYVNGQGQTMVVIPGPVEFMMGSPATEVGREKNERQHKRRIGRTFSISFKSVTLEQYRKFNNDYSPRNEVYARTADLPVVEMTWWHATEYCNWLSREEGIPEDQWCFETENNETMLKKNYLGLTGYRLPTEAEYEYATRAGSTTARFFGETDELLAKYAWYANNSKVRTQPVGRLKPNDLGLFDMHGNVFAWCQDQYLEYSNDEQVIEDKDAAFVIDATSESVLRGGSFRNPQSHIRSALRNALTFPTTHSLTIGFRVARTIQVVPQVPSSTP